jgi:hypothetical protein
LPEGHGGDPLEYANDLSQWLQNEPSDPANNLAVSWHVYPNSNYTGSHTLSMDASAVAGIIPVVVMDIGTATCGGTTYEAHLLATPH